MIGLGPTWQINLCFPGAITADKTVYFEAPADLQLVHVTASCNTQDATVAIYDDGTQINDTLTVTAGTTPLEQDEKGDFVGDQFPHVAKDSVIKVVVGHGSNAVDAMVAITFTVG
jgi:hypothetical protein